VIVIVIVVAVVVVCEISCTWSISTYLTLIPLIALLNLNRLRFDSMVSKCNKEKVGSPSLAREAIR
jgi:glucose-6-phosphate-specific signal transduction histidine kinase